MTVQGETSQPVLPNQPVYEWDTWQDFLNNANEFIQYIAPDGRLLWGNRKWRETFGYSEQDLLDTPLVEIVDPEHRADHEAAWRRLLAGEPLDMYESALLTKDGRTVVVEGNIRPHVDHGRVLAMRAVLCDVTERLRASKAFQEAREEAERSAADLRARTREIARFSELVYLLRSCHQLGEICAVVSRTLPLIFPHTAGALSIMGNNNRLGCGATWGSIRARDCDFQLEDCLALRTGRLRSVDGPGALLPCRHLSEVPPQYLCAPVIAEGGVLGLLHVRSEPSNHVSAGGTPFWTKEPMRRMAGMVAEQLSLLLDNLRLRDSLLHNPIRDPLTMLFNGCCLQEFLGKELRRAVRHNRPVAVGILDIDRFHLFNENYGREAGDRMLRAFAANLKSHVRGEDFTCRYGGEEFVFVLPEASLDAVRERAELIHKETKQIRVRAKGEDVGGLTLSIGVAAFPEHGKTVECLLGAADRALYDAKTLGRDRVVVAPPQV